MFNARWPPALPTASPLPLPLPGQQQREQHLLRTGLPSGSRRRSFDCAAASSSLTSASHAGPSCPRPLPHSASAAPAPAASPTFSAFTSTWSESASVTSVATAGTADTVRTRAGTPVTSGAGGSYGGGAAESRRYSQNAAASSASPRYAAAAIRPGEPLRPLPSFKDTRGYRQAYGEPSYAPTSAAAVPSGLHMADGTPVDRQQLGADDLYHKDNAWHNFLYADTGVETWKLSKLPDEAAGGAVDKDPYMYMAAGNADDDDEELKNLAQRQGPAPAPRLKRRKPLLPSTPSFMRGCLTGAPARIRGLLFVLLVAAMLWIPGTVGLIASRSLDHPAVAQVGLTWWSIWLSTIWLSWFACRASGRLVPRVLRRTVGAISLASRHWIAYLVAIQDYSAFFVWTLIVYITWLAFIWSHFQGPAQQLLSPVNGNTTTTVTAPMTAPAANTASQASSMIAASRFLLGLSICATLLLLEKLSIQIIAYTFHQVSYASRIAECKLHIRVLTLLFEHSRRDLTQEGIELDAEMQMAQLFVDSRLRTGGGGGAVASASSGLEGTEATALDTSLGSSIKSRTGMFRQFHRRADSSKPRNNALAAAAADMAVQVIALPNAAQRIVLAALGDAEQTRHLAKRLFYSFARRDKSDRLVVRFVDFAAVLGEESFSQAAWAIFDCDGNGDLLEEEMEAACLEIRTERMSVINSVRDIDSAVATLDSMFMSCFVVISLTIIAALLSVKFANLIASFGTALLGLSWLISGGAQELLTAIVFLFIKHPYDVGDLVTIVDLKADFIVEEMKLLSTIFRTMAGEYFQISNAKLASSNGIVNTRRSGPTIEKFQLEISYATTYQQLENLRAKMLLWLAEQDRDFLPGLDIQILDMKAQGSMSVSVGIRYKSNFQDHLLKAQRRNMWLCRFKQIMAELQIEGPDAKATPPWSNSKGEAAKEAVRGGVDREYCLMDKKQDYEGTLRRRRAKPKAEHQDDEKKPTTENAPQHGLYSMPRYTPAATLARSQPSNFRRGIDDYEQHMHS